MNHQEQDSLWMKQALAQGKKGLGNTSPNPPVGAVIVKDNQLIGIGHHRQAGQPHAEREAIQHVIDSGFGKSLLGSTIYVTLEPCSTEGRTPPCTDAIIEHGIKRVVYGLDDPNPANAKKSKDVLMSHHIEVTSGIMEAECRDLVKGFMMAHEQKRPWVIAKTAMTLDGRITRAPGKGQWITGQEARQRVHAIRSMSDAVLIGGETLRQDNPALTVRVHDRKDFELLQQPWRVILTNDREMLPRNSRCFCDEHQERTLVCERVDDYHALLQSLTKDHNIHILMLECGGNLLRQFLECRLVDEWIGFYAPMVTAGPSFGVSGDFLTSEVHLDQVSVEQLGKDTCIQGLIRYSS